jgi:hypothetical protein
MKTIYVGLQKPERMGVSGTRWLILDEDNTHIVGLQKMETMMKEFGVPDVDYKRVDLTPDLCNLFLKREVC